MSKYIYIYMCVCNTHILLINTSRYVVETYIHTYMHIIYVYHIYIYIHILEGARRDPEFQSRLRVMDIDEDRV